MEGKKMEMEEKKIDGEDIAVFFIATLAAIGGAVVALVIATIISTIVIGR